MSGNFQRVGFLVLVPPLLRELGVQPAVVLRAAGLAPGALDDPDARVSYAEMGHLIQTCVDLTGCDHFGLLLGQRAGTLSLGLVGQLMSHAPTLGTALRDLVDHQHRNARGSVVFLLDQGADILFGYAIYQSNIEAAVQLYDGAVALAFGIIRKAIGISHLDGLEALLSRAAPDDIDPYLRYFGVKVAFDSDMTGVLLPRHWMDRPVVGADPGVRAELERRVDLLGADGDQDIVTRLRRALSTGLLTGRVGGDELAAQLGTARRTLNRRLEEHGVTFQRILDETRFEFARQLLGNTHLGIAQIAAVLRYGDQSVFTRAFARWSGLPPREWRRTARSQSLADLPRAAIS